MQGRANTFFWKKFQNSPALPPLSPLPSLKIKRNFPKENRLLGRGCACPVYTLICLCLPSSLIAELDKSSMALDKSIRGPCKGRTRQLHVRLIIPYAYILPAYSPSLNWHVYKVNIKRFFSFFCLRQVYFFLFFIFIGHRPTNEDNW